MSLSIAGRTWEEASSPAALGIARRYEAAWHEAGGSSRRPDLDPFLAEAGAHPGARLALLRADMVLRWETGERVGAGWYLTRFPHLEREALVALIYEEFCLSEEKDESPDPDEFLSRYSAVESQLRRVLDIHGLVGSAETSEFQAQSSLSVTFPQAGETIGGFRLVKELGRGAFARVFLAEERQLADRPVALKVARTGSREPQLLARLQHTHIVPVHSYRTDPATGLHLLCMPYFGRVTLARLLAKTNVDAARTGADLLFALDRLDPEETLPSPLSPGRAALANRTYPQAIAWWGARMAEALEHAHVRGVLHRDVKPSNVLITGDGLPMLLDFNLARVAITDADDPEGSVPGGTVDYMSPEHLEELAEGLFDRVGSRSDVYGLGVLLYEAIMGVRPFPPPRGMASVTELLLRAAADRRAGTSRMRAERPEVPAALEVVVARCLAPDPEDRYASAAELAVDLQAVADDGPLRFAREPFPARAYRWARGNRRKLVAAVPIVATLAVLSTLFVHERNIAVRRFAEYQARYDEVKREYVDGTRSEADGNFGKAMDQFEGAERHADYPVPGKWTRLLVGAPGSGETWLSLAELKSLAHRKQVNSALTGTARDKARRFFRAASPLRFVLTGFGSDLESASIEVEKALEPLNVFKYKPWVVDHDLTLLEPGQRAQLIDEVNELLFLWAILLENSKDARACRRAAEICEIALTFAEPAGPWRVLQARLEGRKLTGPPAGSETSALGCFQWGLLARERRPDAAIVWFRTAVESERKNSWYHYYLAYAYDQYAKDGTSALRHYEVALSSEDRRPWVRFSRARIYRQRGLWGLAEKEFELALDDFRALPVEARHPGFKQKARLELGLVRHSLGKLDASRADYDWVIATAPASSEAYAARLNLAKLEADSGALVQAVSAYDALLAANPADGSARFGRALLRLRQDHTSAADDDLSRLLECGAVDRREVLSQRAAARLRMGRKTEALADVDEALALAGTPFLDRLRVRVLLALGRSGELAFTRPEEVEALPLAGPTLRDDVLSMAAQLRHEERAGGPCASLLRAHLTRAVLLSAARGYEGEAVTEAGRAVDLAPLAAKPHLVRARILRRAGLPALARFDLDQAAVLEPENPGVWELRGVLKMEAGDPAGGLADLDQALARGARNSVHVARAEALMALGRPSKALTEWSTSTRADPDDPTAYLGRAQAFLVLRQYDQAFADLEQASNWIDGRPALGLRVLMTYARCAAARPTQVPRLILLARRVFGDFGPVEGSTASTSTPRTVKPSSR